MSVVSLTGHPDVFVTNPELFDANKIKYSELGQNTYGGKELYMNYEDGKHLQFVTPRLYCPFGLIAHENVEKDGKITKNYRLAMSFKGYNDPKDPSYEKKHGLFEMISEIDSRTVEEGMKNSLEWIKIKTAAATGDVVRALFNPTIKNDDKGYPPIMNTSLSTRDGKIVEVYNEDKTPVENPEEILTKGCEVKCLMRAQKVTFPQGKFGIKYQILNMKVWGSKGGLKNRGCLIQDESDDE